MPRIRRIVCLFLIDVFLLHSFFYLALVLRFDGTIPPVYWVQYLRLALPYTLVTGIVFVKAQLYSSLWRHASTEELTRIVGGVSVNSALLLLLTVFSVSQPFPWTVVFIHWLLMLIGVGGIRLAYRTARRLMIVRSRRSNSDKPSVIIVGAGDAGSMVLTELLREGYGVVGFVDDDVRKKGLQLRGKLVLGTSHEIPNLLDRYPIDEIVLAIPSASADRISGVIKTINSAHHDVQLRTFPALHELIDGKVTINQIRPVAIEDLLGRKPVRVNLHEMSSYLQGQVVLITGAGGSIGSELCRQIARFQPAELVLLEHAENPLFEIALELRNEFRDLNLRQVIADVRDRPKIDTVFARTKPSVVFHAAAHKHVPLMEDFPEEAVKTNVFGTQNVAQSSVRNDVKKFVLISTDKAVNPTSIMGTTKRVAELLVQDLNRAGKTKFVAVRFGNVLGSNGSVIPVFKKQIEQGGPVTVTDPKMVRYFMTIPEAVQLVIQAGAVGQGGEVFVLDMGDPVRILDLAQNLITLSGFEPGRDIKIVFTGKRPGEKLYEEILTAEEGTDVTEHERIFVARTQVVESDMLANQLARLYDCVSGGQAERLVGILRDLVPTFTPGEHHKVPSRAFELKDSNEKAISGGAAFWSSTG